MESIENISRISFSNRYRDKVYLERVSDIVYRLVVDTPLGVDFTRYGYDSWPDSIEFVDPPGGPFLCLGEHTKTVFVDGVQKIAVFTVDRIRVTFKEDSETVAETLLDISSIKIKNE